MNIRGLVLLFFLMTSIFLSGCSNDVAKRPDLKSDYEFEAVINYGDKAFNIYCVKESEQWKFTYKSPAQLIDMEVILENENYKISYNGLIQEGLRSEMPDSNICDFVARSLEYITRGKGIEFHKKDDIIIGNGVFDGGDLKVTYDKNRLPKEIIIGKDIEIKFNSFKKV